MKNKKKTTINVINKNDDKSSLHTLITALNHEKTYKGLHRISKIKPFIMEYKLKGTNCPSEKKRLETVLEK